MLRVCALGWTPQHTRARTCNQIISIELTNGKRSTKSDGTVTRRNSKRWHRRSFSMSLMVNTTKDGWWSRGVGGTSHKWVTRKFIDIPARVATASLERAPAVAAAASPWCSACVSTSRWSSSSEAFRGGPRATWVGWPRPKPAIPLPERCRAPDPNEKARFTQQWAISERKAYLLRCALLLGAHQCIFRLAEQGDFICESSDFLGSVCGICRRLLLLEHVVDLAERALGMGVVDDRWSVEVFSV